MRGDSRGHGARAGRLFLTAIRSAEQSARGISGRGRRDQRRWRRWLTIGRLRSGRPGSAALVGKNHMAGPGPSRPLGPRGIRDCPFLRVELCLIPTLKPRLTFVAVFWIRTRRSFYAATESVHAFVKRVTTGRNRHLFTPNRFAKHTRSEGDTRARVNTCRFQTEALPNSGTPRESPVALGTMVGAHGIMPRRPAQKLWLAEGISRSTWYRRGNRISMQPEIAISVKTRPIRGQRKVCNFLYGNLDGPGTYV
jgi:hypothetical protein